MTVPAQLRYLGLVRDAVRIAMDGSGAHVTCENDIALAVDELAALLILHAQSAGELGVAVTHDATELHVELRLANSAGTSCPVLDQLNTQLLEATTDAHVVYRVGPDLVGRLRRRLNGFVRLAGIPMDTGARREAHVEAPNRS